MKMNNMKSLLALSIAMVSLIIVGCGSKPAEEPAVEPAPTTTSTPAPAPATPAPGVTTPAPTEGGADQSVAPGQAGTR